MSPCAAVEMQAGLALWCNPGSCGHPSLCARPCIYLAKNGACHVDGCNFCHMPHDQPASKLNQRQRYVLRQLDHKSKMDLMLEAVREGLEREGLATHAAEMTRLLEEEAAKYPQQAGPRSQKRQLHDLRKAFMRMTVSDTIKSFEDVLPEKALQYFQDLRQGLVPQPPQTSALTSKCELTLKDALALYPFPRTTLATWIL